LSYVWPAAARLTMQHDATDYARYCYSVWLRHMVLAYRHGLRRYPQTVLELGPGASLGVGLAALISGAARYYALDVERGVDTERELGVFDRVVELFRRRELIPGPEEFPLVQPTLEAWDFPAFVFESAALEEALAPLRLRNLRTHLTQPETRCSPVRYTVGWDAGQSVPEEGIDFVISQAVMERVEDLPRAYRAIARWLRPGGFTSHSIDFGEPLTSGFWNGNWARSDLTWRLMRGRQKSWSNREPHSAHIRCMTAQGLRIVANLAVEDSSGLPRERLATRYQGLDEEDLRTRSAYILALKPVKQNGYV
jgi:SAM-dependent methyltransferase